MYRVTVSLKLEMKPIKVKMMGFITADEFPQMADTITRYNLNPVTPSLYKHKTITCMISFIESIPLAIDSLMIPC